MIHISSENKKLFDSGAVNNIGNWFFKVAVTLIPLLAYIADIAGHHDEMGNLFSFRNVAIYIAFVQLLFSFLIYILGEPTKNNWDDETIINKIKKSDYYHKSPEQYKSLLDDNYLSNTLLILKTHFSKYWSYVWGTWVLLYGVLFFTKCIIYKENLNPCDSSFYNNIVSNSEIALTLLTNLFSYLNSFCILTLYLVLVHKFDFIKPTKDRNITFKRYANRGFVIAIFLVLVELVIYFSWDVQNGYVNRGFYSVVSNAFGIVNGIIACVCFTFVISRLVGSLTTDFKYKNYFYLPFLFLYCAIQPLYVYVTAFYSEPNDSNFKTIIMLIILILALFGKYVLYYVITKLFESRKILFHFLETNAINSRVNASGKLFEEIWIEENKDKQNEKS